MNLVVRDVASHNIAHNILMTEEVMDYCVSPCENIVDVMFRSMTAMIYDLTNLLLCSNIFKLPTVLDCSTAFSRDGNVLIVFDPEKGFYVDVAMMVEVYGSKLVFNALLATLTSFYI